MPATVGSVIATEGFFGTANGTFWGARNFGFKQGDCPSGKFAVVAGGYVTPRSTWPDGSLKYAFVIAQWTILGGYGEVNATLSNTVGASAPTGTAPTISVGVSFTGGGTASCSVTGQSNAVGTDPILKIRRNDLTFFTSTTGFCVLVVENTTIAQTGGGDRSGTYTPIINGVVQAGVPLTVRGRCHRPLGGRIASGIYFFGMTDPGLTVAINQQRLEEMGFPPFRGAAIPEGTLAALAQSYGEDDPGEGPDDMATTGPAETIGNLPASSGYAMRSGDVRAITHMLASAATMGTRGEIVRDEATGFPVVTSDHQYLSTNSSDHGDYLSAMSGSNPHIWEPAHHPLLSALAYATTGLTHHYEGVVFVAMYCYLRGTDSGRGGSNGWMRHDGGQYQYRGVSWSYRSLAYAISLCPDDYHNRADLIGWFERNLSFQIARAVNGTFDESTIQYGGANGWCHNTLGIFAPVQNNPENPDYLYIAIWMHWFGVAALGMAREMDLPLTTGGAADLVTVTDFVNLSMAGMTAPAGSTTLCDYRRLDEYGIPIAHGDYTVLANWKACQNALELSNGLSPLPADDHIMRAHYFDGEIDSGQGWFPSFMGDGTPALTYAAKRSSDAAAGYARVFGSNTYNTLKGDSVISPQWAILLDALPAATPTLTGFWIEPADTFSGAGSITPIAAPAPRYFTPALLTDGSRYFGSVPLTTATFSGAWTEAADNVVGSGAIIIAGSVIATIAWTEGDDIVDGRGRCTLGLPMRTVRDLCRRALRLAGGLGAGEPGDPEELSDALLALNHMLDAWSADRLMIFTNNEFSFSLDAGQSTYLIGPTGDFVIQRPTRFAYAFTRDQYGLDRPVAMPSRAEFAAITMKDLGSNTFPEAVAIDDGYPNTSMTFYPSPMDGLKLFLGVSVPLGGYLTINDTVTLPPGYEDAIVCSLAEIIAPEYQRTVTPVVSGRALAGRTAIRSANLPPAPAAVCDFLSNAYRGDGKAAFLAGY